MQNKTNDDMPSWMQASEEESAPAQDEYNRLPPNEPTQGDSYATLQPANGSDETYHQLGGRKSPANADMPGWMTPQQPSTAGDAYANLSRFNEKDAQLPTTMQKPSSHDPGWMFSSSRPGDKQRDQENRRQPLLGTENDEQRKPSMRISCGRYMVASAVGAVLFFTALLSWGLFVLSFLQKCPTDKISNYRIAGLFFEGLVAILMLWDYHKKHYFRFSYLWALFGIFFAAFDFVIMCFDANAVRLYGDDCDQVDVQPSLIPVGDAILVILWVTSFWMICNIVKRPE